MQFFVLQTQDDPKWVNNNANDKLLYKKVNTFIQ